MEKLNKLRIIDIAISAITWLEFALNLTLKNVKVSTTNFERITSLIQSLEGVKEMFEELKVRK